MATDMFIKIGDEKGESQDDGHKDEIDVLGWGWGMSNSGTAHAGGGSGGGKVSVGNLTFTKWVDCSSPNLMTACCQGDHYKTATLTVRKAGGDPVEYIKIALSQVLITQITSGGSGLSELLSQEARSDIMTIFSEKVLGRQFPEMEELVRLGYDRSRRIAWLELRNTPFLMTGLREDGVLRFLIGAVNRFRVGW